MSDPVGALGARRLARVDARGGVRPDGSSLALDWWVGADDRWHRASDEAAVRRRRLGEAPVYETAMRVPGGDVVQRVYGLAGPAGPIVVEVENETPVPVALALVVHGARRPPPNADVVPLDRSVRLLLARPAAHVVSAAGTAALAEALRAGPASSPAVGRPGAGLSVAFLQPLAHRTRLRGALLLGKGRAEPETLATAPEANEAAQGWTSVGRRGMQVTLPDPADGLALERARVDLVLEAGARPTADRFAALEDWGLDTEAVTAWRGLGWRARRRARRRVDPVDPAARLLRATRDALVAEGPDGSIALVPEPRRRGEPLEVHDAPTRVATVSFAVRWHGDRPALLWDARPVGGSRGRSVCLTAPGLDASWSTTQPAGDALLAADGAVEARGSVEA